MGFNTRELIEFAREMTNRELKGVADVHRLDKLFKQTLPSLTKDDLSLLNGKEKLTCVVELSTKVTKDLDNLIVAKVSKMMNKVRELRIRRIPFSCQLIQHHHQRTFSFSFSFSFDCCSCHRPLCLSDSILRRLCVVAVWIFVPGLRGRLKEGTIATNLLDGIVDVLSLLLQEVNKPLQVADLMLEVRFGL